MVLTKNNLNEVIFENEDARLLMLDILSNTEANIYYFHGIEITAEYALKLWQRAYGNTENHYNRTILEKRPRYNPYKNNVKVRIHR